MLARSGNESTIIGVDVGGTKTTVVEGTFDARILAREELPTNAAAPFTQSWAPIAQSISDAIARSRQAGRAPGGVSVAVGGPLLAAAGRLLDPPNLPGWHGVLLGAEIERVAPGLDVRIEHDAKAGALAEYRFGVGAARPELREMIFLTFGTGLGAGIIANGSLVRGASEMAGEIWNMAVPTPAGEEAAARSRRWEDRASGRGIAAIAGERFPGRWVGTNVTHQVVAAAVAGDADARQVITSCGRWLGAGLAPMVAVLNPRVVVLGSLAAVLGDMVLDSAREELARLCERRAAVECEILPSALGARLGDVQSLMAVLESRRK